MSAPTASEEHMAKWCDAYDKARAGGLTFADAAKKADEAVGYFVPPKADS